MKTTKNGVFVFSELVLSLLVFKFTQEISKSILWTSISEMMMTVRGEDVNKVRLFSPESCRRRYLMRQEQFVNSSLVNPAAGNIVIVNELAALVNWIAVGLKAVSDLQSRSLTTSHHLASGTSSQINGSDVPPVGNQSQVHPNFVLPEVSAVNQSGKEFKGAGKMINPLDYSKKGVKGMKRGVVEETDTSETRQCLQFETKKKPKLHPQTQDVSGTERESNNEKAMLAQWIITKFANKSPIDMYQYPLNLEAQQSSNGMRQSRRTPFESSAPSPQDRMAHQNATSQVKVNPNCMSSKVPQQGSEFGQRVPHTQQDPWETRAISLRSKSLSSVNSSTAQLEKTSIPVGAAAASSDRQSCYESWSWRYDSDERVEGSFFTDLHEAQQSDATFASDGRLGDNCGTILTGSKDPADASKKPKSSPVLVEPKPLKNKGSVKHYDNNCDRPRRPGRRRNKDGASISQAVEKLQQKKGVIVTNPNFDLTSPPDSDRVSSATPNHSAEDNHQDRYEVIQCNKDLNGIGHGPSPCDNPAEKIPEEVAESVYIVGNEAVDDAQTNLFLIRTDVELEVAGLAVGGNIVSTECMDEEQLQLQAEGEPCPKSLGGIQEIISVEQLLGDQGQPGSGESTEEIDETPGKMSALRVSVVAASKSPETLEAEDESSPLYEALSDTEVSDVTWTPVGNVHTEMIVPLDPVNPSTSVSCAAGNSAGVHQESGNLVAFDFRDVEGNCDVGQVCDELEDDSTEVLGHPKGIETNEGTEMALEYGISESDGVIYPQSTDPGTSTEDTVLVECEIHTTEISNTSRFDEHVEDSETEQTVLISIPDEAPSSPFENKADVIMSDSMSGYGIVSQFHGSDNQETPQGSSLTSADDIRKPQSSLETEGCLEIDIIQTRSVADLIRTDELDTESVVGSEEGHEEDAENSRIGSFTSEDDLTTEVTRAPHHEIEVEVVSTTEEDEPSVATAEDNDTAAETLHEDVTTTPRSLEDSEYQNTALQLTVEVEDQLEIGVHEKDSVEDTPGNDGVAADGSGGSISDAETGMSSEKTIIDEVDIDADDASGPEDILEKDVKASKSELIRLLNEITHECSTSLVIIQDTFSKRRDIISNVINFSTLKQRVSTGQLDKLDVLEKSIRLVFFLLTLNLPDHDPTHQEAKMQLKFTEQVFKNFRMRKLRGRTTHRLSSTIGMKSEEVDDNDGEIVVLSHKKFHVFLGSDLRRSRTHKVRRGTRNASPDITDLTSGGKMEGNERGRRRVKRQRSTDKKQKKPDNEKPKKGATTTTTSVPKQKETLDTSESFTSHLNPASSSPDAPDTRNTLPEDPSDFKSDSNASTSNEVKRGRFTSKNLS